MIQMTIDQPADLALPASPAAAYREQLGVLYSVAAEAARRREPDLPGLVESLERLLINSGTTGRKVYGWFSANTWRYGNQQVHELFLNADTCHHHPSISKAEASS